MSCLTRFLDVFLALERDALLPYIAIQIHSFITIALLVFLSATQAFLIIYTYNVSPFTVGTVMGQLSVADEVVSILSLIFWGGLSDRAGRKVVLVLGYAITALSLFMLPLGRVWSPDLILTRMLFAFGSSALSSIMAAMLADVVQPRGLPRATALAGIMSGVGALVSAFGFLGMGAYYCMKIVYFIVAGITIVVGMVVCGLYYFAVTPEKPTTKEVALGFTSVPMLAWNNKFLGLALLGSFAARMASTVGSAFISSWFTVYMTYVSGECPAPGNQAAFANATTSFCGLDTRCKSAVSHSASANGIMQTLALVGAPFVAIVVEYVPDTSYALFLACTFSAFAFSFVVTVPNPRSSQLYGVMAAMGVGQIFMIISSQVMLIRNISSPTMRGTLSGSFSAIGALGVIMVSVWGGDLFDAGFYQGPFLLTGVTCALLGALTLVAIIIYRPHNNRKDAEEKDNANVLVVADLRADVESKPAAAAAAAVSATVEPESKA